MKNLKQFYVLSIMAVAVIFASCGTSVDIAKRHFNGGYYVNVHKSKVTAAKKEIVAAEDISLTNQTQAAIVAESVPAQKEIMTTKDEMVADISPENASSLPFYTAPVINKSSELLPSAEPVKHKVSVKKINREIKRKVEQLKGGSVPGILLVILCIFIPPVAVLIVDDVNKPFWIDLILWILGFGGGIGVNSFAFIFWLIAIIYAFTICF